MKNFNACFLMFSLIFSSSLLFSCGNSKKDSTENDTNIDSTQIENQNNEEVTNLSNNYHTFIASLNTSKMSSALEAAQKFKELYANATPEQSDEGFVIFNALYDTLVVNLNNLHYANSENYEKYEQIAGIYNGYNDEKEISDEMKAYQEELTKNGFGIGMTEGSTYILQNRDFLERYFYDKVSSSMKIYLIQKNKEAKEIYTEDGGLIISPTLLAERIIWTEKFIKENPNFPAALMKELTWTRKAYFRILLEGLDNTPVIDYETKALNTEYEEAYKMVISTYPETETALLLKPYYEAIKNKNTKKVEELIAKYSSEEKIY